MFKRLELTVSVVFEFYYSENRNTNIYRIKGTTVSVSLLNKYLKTDTLNCQGLQEFQTKIT